MYRTHVAIKHVSSGECYPTSPAHPLVLKRRGQRVKCVTVLFQQTPPNAHRETAIKVENHNSFTSSVSNVLVKDRATRHGRATPRAVFNGQNRVRGGRHMDWKLRGLPGVDLQYLRLHDAQVRLICASQAYGYAMDTSWLVR